EREASHQAVPISAHVITTTRTTFLEHNTTDLPNAVSSESRPSITTSQQRRFLEVNTDWLPVVGSDALANPAESTQAGDMTPLRGHEQVPGLLAQPGTASAVMPMMNEQQRTLEESTTAAATVPDYRTINGAAPSMRECTHPMVGFPTCYV